MNNKVIAKNSIFLFIRMLIILFITLYTSRVILQALGVEDYGTYQAVGGIIGLLSFLNAALSNGSSRFITFEMGKTGNRNLQKVFQTTFVTHLIMAIIIIILAETIGLWFIHNKLVIPAGRLEAALYVYQCSIITAVITITQVPYTALIIAHEKMSIYAYMSIIEAILKLLIVFLLLATSFDRLKLYALLLCLVQIMIAFGYRFYCIKKYKESSLKGLRQDNQLLKEILSFSSWSLIGNGVHALNGQGLTIITNMFFNPAVVAARALSIQVNAALLNLLQNFRTAANPQIIKLYSAGEINNSKELMLSTTKFSFYLMLLLSVPIISVTTPLLSLWLKEVPEYTAIFVQLILIQSLFYTFDTCFYTALYACGKVKENALISPFVYILQFIITYFLFRAGYSPISLSILGIITSILASCIVKPILLKRYANYNYKEIYKLICLCCLVGVCCIPITYIAEQFITTSISSLILKVLIVTIITLIVIVIIGLSKTERRKIHFNINKLIKNK